MSAHLRTAWRTIASGGTYYHLTGKADFRLDPTFRPDINTTIGGEMPPGIFLTKDPQHWAEGYGYRQPWVIEFQVPSGLPGVEDRGMETFVPAEHFDRLQITRVLSLDGYVREEFGSYGSMESDLEEDHLTGEPLSYEDDITDYFRFRGWRCPDMRTMDSSWRTEYAAKIRKWRGSRSNAYASKTASIQTTGSVRSHLEMMAEMQRRSRGDKGWAYASIEEMILTHGREFEPAPLPDDIECGPMKECYSNAMQLAMMRSDLTYVEGYAFSVAFPMGHGWVTADGRTAIDPTWSDGSSYFGIPFNTSWVRRFVSQTGYWGVMFPEMPTQPFMDLLRNGLPPEALA